MLKPHHEQAVREYLKFCRYKRLECLRSVTSYYESLIESQLADDAPLTTSEVDALLAEVLAALAEFEAAVAEPAAAVALLEALVA